MWLGFSLLILLVVIAMSVIISKLTGGLEITEQSAFQETAKGMENQAFVSYKSKTEIIHHLSIL